MKKLLFFPLFVLILSPVLLQAGDRFGRQWDQKEVDGNQIVEPSKDIDVVDLSDVDTILGNFSSTSGPIGGGSLDDAYNIGSEVTVDQADVIFNLVSSYDFVIQDDGTPSFVVGKVGDITAYDMMLIGVHGSGAALDVSGAGTRCFFYPKKSAWRCGAISGTEWNDSNIGLYSYAEGFGNIASSNQAHAEGNFTTASAAAAHSEGQATIASAQWSHAQNVATEANGDASHSGGRYVIIDAADSFGHGKYLRSSSAATNSVMFGLYSSAAERDANILTDPNVFKIVNQDLLLEGGDIIDPVITNSFSVNSFDNISSNHTVTDTDYVHLVDATDGNVTITLPAVASTQAGRMLRFKKTDSTNNQVIIDGSGGETIDGALTKTLISENQGMMIINDGTEWKLLQLTGRVSSFKSYAISPASSGTSYFAGFYHADPNDVNLTQAAPTGSHGSANQPEAARAFWVSGGAGSASGGSGAVTVVVSGTSITDAGVRTGSDTEVIVSDITAMSLNDYLQTDKKWIGTIVYTLTCTGGCTHTTYSSDGNIGHAKFEDFGNSGSLGFTVTDFEIVGQAGANDTGFDVDLVDHDCTGWTYAATGFVPGNGDIASLDTDYGAESDLTSGEFFAYKRDNLSTFVDTNAACKEGMLGRIVTGTNNSISFATAHIGVRFP